MKIYVVFGNTGEYSDYREWMVCAYKKEDLAMARVSELEHLLTINGANKDIDWDEREKIAARIRSVENGDPGCDIDYTGSNYFYRETELK